MSANSRSDAVADALFDFEQQEEAERVLEWLTDYPDEAAAYIVWLESKIPDRSKS